MNNTLTFDKYRKMYPSKSIILPVDLDGVHFRCDLQDLGHPWTDLDKIFGAYRVHPESYGQGCQRISKFTWDL